MKKILLTLFTVAAGIVSVNAQEESRLVISAGQLKNITLGEDMKVVLVSEGQFQSEVKGDMNVFDKLNISVVDGAMRISAVKKLHETVYIVVNQLGSLSLGQNTKVDTKGVLRSHAIKVFVEQGAVARLITTGEVNATSLQDHDLEITKKPIQLN